MNYKQEKENYQETGQWCKKAEEKVEWISISLFQYNLGIKSKERVAKRKR